MGERLDWVISVDDHVIEPPTVWSDRLPKKYADVGPKWVYDDEGEAWVYEGKRIALTGLSAVAGKPREEWSPAPLTLDSIRPSCYDAKARVDDMNVDGILAQACFPSFPRFCGQTFYEGDDKTLGLLCVQAYNDWMIDEWAASAPGRFIPLTLIPLWDPIAAATEIERCAAKGGKGIAFSENPSKLGLPSIHDADGFWDPVFAACQDTGTAVCTHIGSSSQLPKTSEDAPMILSITLSILNTQQTLVDWLYSGNFLRFPQLKLVLSEGGISWMPAVIERVRRDVDRQGPWSRHSDFGGNILTGAVANRARRNDVDAYDFDAKEICARQVYGCMIPDDYGWDALDYLGTDNVMVETDFPHSDSTWPNTTEETHKQLGHLSAENRYKIQIGNAARVFNFTPAPIPN